jgi:hypothetical protein
VYIKQFGRGLFEEVNCETHLDGEVSLNWSKGYRQLLKNSLIQKGKTNIVGHGHFVKNSSGFYGLD